MTTGDSNEDFLRRWSRRKIEGEPTEDPAGDAGLPEDGIAAVPEEGNEPEEIDPEVVANLPDIETLDKDSDYTGFLRDGVPEELKRMALRKLWLSDPVLANLDGLNDYDEDFGAILKSGADYMQRLADAGEKFTRPGADEEEPAEAEAEESEDAGEELLAQEAEPDADTDPDLADAGPRGTGESPAG
jgi:hypothetical protein